MSTATLQHFSFRLLRYAPNDVSGEYYNIAALLYDGAGQLAGARFLDRFDRLRCNPLASLEFLQAFADEFEERRLMGEGFSTYVQELLENQSMTVQVSEARHFWGEDAATEIDRTYQIYVANPRPEQDYTEREPLEGSHEALKRKMEDVFRLHHLLGNGAGLNRDVKVNYGIASRAFIFDFECQPNGSVKYVHGVALRNQLDEAEKLSLVYGRMREMGNAANLPVSLTAVLDDQVAGDTRDFLTTSKVSIRNASQLDEVALELRRDFGL